MKSVRDKFIPVADFEKNHLPASVRKIMYQKKIPIDFNCGLDLVKEVIFGKWKIHLIHFIAEGSRRPAELQKKIPAATRRVLNVQLNELEAHGLISKKIYAELPPKVEYSLTDFGKSVVPIVTALGKWGDDHQERLRRALIDR
jgi:DNA-binding HxlR family transcriptional regulator